MYRRVTSSGTRKDTFAIKATQNSDRTGQTIKIQMEDSGYIDIASFPTVIILKNSSQKNSLIYQQVQFLLDFLCL